MTVPSEFPFTNVAGGADDFRIANPTLISVPEPFTIVLLLFGGAALASRRKKALAASTRQGPRP